MCFHKLISSSSTNEMFIFQTNCGSLSVNGGVKVVICFDEGLKLEMPTS